MNSGNANGNGFYKGSGQMSPSPMVPDNYFQNRRPKETKQVTNFEEACQWWNSWTHEAKNIAEEEAVVFLFHPARSRDIRENKRRAVCNKAAFQAYCSKKDVPKGTETWHDLWKKLPEEKKVEWTDKARILRAAQRDQISAGLINKPPVKEKKLKTEK